MMRSVFALATSLASALTFPLASTYEVRPKALQVLEYNPESAYTKFSLPCPATSCSGADESLVFDLQISPTADPLHSDIVINTHVVALTWGEYIAYTSGSVVANSNTGVEHELNYVVSGWVLSSAQLPDDENATEHFQFHIQSVDSIAVADMDYQVDLHPTSSPYLRRMSADGGPDVDAVSIDFGEFAQSLPSPDSDQEASPPDSTSFDLARELESLLLLESDAEELQAKIVAKKHAIATHLREHRDQVSLRHLFKECDGLVCAARVLAQRICDKVGVLTEPALGYAKMQSSRIQTTINSHDGSEVPAQTSRNCTKSKAFDPDREMPSKNADGTEQLNVPLMLTKNAFAADFHFKDLVNPPNPLIRALEVVASLIGISALYSYIRRKCMSMRKRVERAADKEERRNRRAYRKAARRAEMRRQWDNLVNAVSCFRSSPEPRLEDYEEKRALILQEAFLEHLDDLDQAEKGQVMEAEIRELRHAHEIVASLVRVDEHRYGMIAPMNDPPPPLVPLPFTPETRSRASTGTLPSYTSESLPGYSSRPETLVGSSVGGSVVDGFTAYTPSTSDDEERRTPMSVSSGGRTGYTIASSILDVSPRPSEETLRTRQSKDMQDR